MIKKVLLLGSNGFIGKGFLNYIRDNSLYTNYRFVGIDIASSHLEAFDGYTFIKADLSDCLSLEKIILSEKPDYIINLAGVFGSKDFNELLNINAGISRSILEIILRNDLNIERVLLVGSAAEYGPCSKMPIKENCVLSPITEYGFSKVIQTQYALYYMRKGLKINIARTFNVVGAGAPVALSIGNFVNQVERLANGEVIHVGNLNSKRDFLDVNDVVDAYWKIILEGKPNEIYNVCSGESLLMKDVLDRIIKASGKKITVEIDPSFVKSNDVLDSYGDNTKLKKDTGWTNKLNVFKSLEKIK